MESLLHRTATYPTPKQIIGNGFFVNKSKGLTFADGYSFSLSFTPQKPILSLGLRNLVIVGAKKNKNPNNNNNKKEDRHSYVPKPDEATGPFPEAVLLKEKKMQEGGRLLPEFADAEEEKLYEFLNLQLESQVKVEQMRHYEVVYLIHEKHDDEVESVNEKVQDFLREKKGKIWRMNDWGMRRLCYKIRKAKNAHYILMNFELEAKWINDFKVMLDKDERVIRHLVMKRDNAETEDCPPPPEYHTLRAGMDDDDEEDDFDYDDEDGDGDDEGEVEMEMEMEGYDDDMEDDVVSSNGDDDVNYHEDRNNKAASASNGRRKNWAAEKVGR